MSPARSELEGKRVTVAGLGLFGGGAATVRWLLEQGASVTITDLRQAHELRSTLDELAADLRAAGRAARLVLGRHEQQDFTGTDLVVANPAVDPRSPYLSAARQAEVPITSELELVLERIRARTVLITGTQGKSSTASLLAQLLHDVAPRVYLGGNIGHSLLPDLAEMQPDHVAVIEVSSYQLDALPLDVSRRAREGRVEAVAITNALADHIERHGSIEAYRRAKARVLELVRHDGCALLPARDAGLVARVPRGVRLIPHSVTGQFRDGDVGLRRPPPPGLAVQHGRFMLFGQDLGDVSTLNLGGRFQEGNALIALGLAKLLGAPLGLLHSRIPDLRGLPHRSEALGLVAGRRVIDNGISTTPDSTVAPLSALEGDLCLLCGGQAKRGLDWSELTRVAQQRNVSVVTFGASAGALALTFACAGVQARLVSDFDSAVKVALRETPLGGALLFSPGCASFDAFPNFSVRAQRFREIVSEFGREGVAAPLRVL